VSNLHRLGAAAAAAALFAAGCSGKATGTDEAASTSGVKTGPGVTEDTITLGALTDTSGVFGAQGKIIVQGNQLYFDKLNAAGGVCGRQVELVVKDHGTDVQKAVSLYAETEPNVLGYVQMLGSPITTALEPEIVESKTLTVATAWSASLLKNPYMVVVGNTYDVETVNGIEWLAKEKGIVAGDVVGHIYFEGSFGANALQGTQYAASKLGLTVEAIKIKNTDVDLTAQVTTLKARGAKAIVLSVGPKQTASVAGVAASIGYKVPLLANAPAFDPSLLKTPAAGALQSSLTVLSSYTAYSSDVPGAKEVAAAHPAKFPDSAPNGMVDLGYVSALIYAEVLEKACANGDLTREGVATALRQLSSVDTGGLTPALDFSEAGVAPSRETYVQTVDAAVPGGLTVVHGPTEAALAKAYPPAS
jgi:ABC-type branched-subunit amino acid transport system substrate-binding protein